MSNAVTLDLALVSGSGLTIEGELLPAAIPTLTVAVVGAVHARWEQSQPVGLMLTLIVSVLPTLSLQSAYFVVSFTVSATADAGTEGYWLESIVRVTLPGLVVVSTNAQARTTSEVSVTV